MAVTEGHDPFDDDETRIPLPSRPRSGQPPLPTTPAPAPDRDLFDDEVTVYHTTQTAPSPSGPAEGTIVLPAPATPRQRPSFDDASDWRPLSAPSHPTATLGPPPTESGWWQPDRSRINSAGSIIRRRGVAASLRRSLGVVLPVLVLSAIGVAVALYLLW